MNPYPIIAVAVFSFTQISCDAQNKIGNATADPRTTKTAVSALIVEIEAARALYAFNKQSDPRLTATLNAIDTDFHMLRNPPTKDIQYVNTVWPPMWKDFQRRMKAAISASSDRVPQNVIDSAKAFSDAQDNAHEIAIRFLQSVLTFRDALPEPFRRAEELAKAETSIKLNRPILGILRAEESNAEKVFVELALQYVPMLEHDTAKEIDASIKRRTEELKKENASGAK